MLQAADYYAQLIGWGSVLFSVLVFAAAGLRGIALLCAVLVAFLPVLWVAANFVKYVLPPRIEIYVPEDASLRLRD